MQAFLCYSSKDSKFVLQVASHLRRHFKEVFAFEDSQRTDQSFPATLEAKIKSSDVFLVFVGNELAQWQREEIEVFIRDRRPGKHCLVIGVNGQTRMEQLQDLTAWIQGYAFLPDNYTSGLPPQVVHCAKDIITKLNIPDLAWKGGDGLPFNPHLFDYEKRIIDFYVTKNKLDVDEPLDDDRKKHVRKMLFEGCPDSWPDVRRLYDSPDASLHDNKLPKEIRGDDRPPESKVLAAALTHARAGESGLFLREAGPRAKLLFPRGDRRELNVGILVLGGIAPGINAVIDAIVSRHWLYADHQNYDVNIFGFQNGLWAFKNILDQRYRVLRPDRSWTCQHPNPLDTADHATEGGSVLGTWRDDTLTDPETRPGRLREIVEFLKELNIDILYVIGGDGSMKAAHGIFNVAKERTDRIGTPPMSVVAVPKTMDNDILWMWQSFGFSSAVQRARAIVEELHTEVKSNPRLCVLQLYGSDSGFVVSHTVLASATGHCDLALIPEQPFSMIEVAQQLKSSIRKAHRPIPYGLVVMAETAVPIDALECLGVREFGSDDKVRTEVLRKLWGNVDPQRENALRHLYRSVSAELREKSRLRPEEIQAICKFIELRTLKRRIEGQTNDQLRQASLHLVMHALPLLLKSEQIRYDFIRPMPPEPDWSRLRLMANEPRHLLRATTPSTSDITMAQRLGILAVDNALAGYTDFMISQWLTEYVLVPLELVVLGRKRIPEEGIFWKSVLAKTGQTRVRRPD